jgi:hypothetical protein
VALPSEADDPYVQRRREWMRQYRKRQSERSADRIQE